MNKREWWLDIATPYGDPCDFISEKPYEHPSATNIHVIEFSAYEQLQQQCEKLAEALESIEYNLEGYPDNRCEACSYNLQNIRPTAKEALIEYKAFKNNPVSIREYK